MGGFDRMDGSKEEPTKLADASGRVLYEVTNGEHDLARTLGLWTGPAHSEEWFRKKREQFARSYIPNGHYMSIEEKDGLFMDSLCLHEQFARVLVQPFQVNLGQDC